MNRNLLLVVGLVISSPLFAKPVGSYCPLDDGGKKILPPHGYVATPVKTNPKKDVYRIEPSPENPYGGSPQTWTAYKDSQGRIIRLESGGEKPSQKLINFERKRLEEELNAMYSAPKKDKKFSLPSLQDVKTAMAKPEDYPIRFGASVDMEHSGSKCNIQKMSERFYYPESQKELPNIVFNSERCQVVRQVMREIEDDLISCDKKTKSYDSTIAAILNDNVGGGGYTSGAGGGGGSPIRTVASTSNEVDTKPNFHTDESDRPSIKPHYSLPPDVTTIRKPGDIVSNIKPSRKMNLSINSYLLGVSGGSNNSAEAEYCEVLAPQSLTPEVEEGDVIRKPTSVTSQ